MVQTQTQQPNHQTYKPIRYGKSKILSHSFSLVNKLWETLSVHAIMMQKQVRVQSHHFQQIWSQIYYLLTHINQQQMVNIKYKYLMQTKMLYGIILFIYSHNATVVIIIGLKTLQRHRIL